MKDTMRYQLDALKRVHQYGIDNPLVPVIPTATAAFTAVGSSITLVETLDSNRLNGNSTWRSASEERQFLRRQLRNAVSDLSRVAKTLDKMVHPDVAAQLKMGRVNTYAHLLALANNAVTVITPIKQVFIERGAPATFLEDLQDAIDAMQAARGRGISGRGSRVGSNAELKVAIRAGMDQVRILDGILSLVLKPTAGLMAEWKSAKRVQRSAAPEVPATPPPVTSAA